MTPRLGERDERVLDHTPAPRHPQALPHRRVVCSGILEIRPGQAEYVAVGHGPRRERRLGSAAQHLLPEHLPAGEHPPFTSHDAPLHDVHLGGDLPGVYDFLPLRKRLRLELEGDVDDEAVGGAVEERDVVDPAAALFERNLTAQRRGHELEQLEPLLDVGAGVSVPKVVAQSHLELVANLHLPGHRVEGVHALVVLVALLVHARDDAAHAADDVGKHGGSDEHGEDDEKSLLRVRGRHVTVADGAHRHQRPVQRRDVHVPRRQVHARVQLVRELRLRVARGEEIGIDKVAVVIRHPVILLRDGPPRELPEARQPVRDHQRAQDELHQRQHVVVHVHGVLQPLQDAPRSQDAEQLHEPEQTQQLERLEATRGFHLVERDDGHDVHHEEPPHVPPHDLLPVRDVHPVRRLLVVVYEVKVRNDVGEEQEIDDHVDDVDWKRGQSGVCGAAALAVQERHLVRRDRGGVHQRHPDDDVPALHPPGPRVEEER